MPVRIPARSAIHRWSLCSGCGRLRAFNEAGRCESGLLSFGSTMWRRVLVWVIDAFPQFLADFEVRQVFCRNLDRLSGCWIAALPGGSIVQNEAPESPDFDAITAGEGAGEGIQDQGHREFRILGGERHGEGCKTVDEVGTIHR